MSGSRFVQILQDNMVKDEFVMNGATREQNDYKRQSCQTDI